MLERGDALRQDVHFQCPLNIFKGLTQGLNNLVFHEEIDALFEHSGPILDIRTL